MLNWHFIGSLVYVLLANLVYLQDSPWLGFEIFSQIKDHCWFISQHKIYMFWSSKTRHLPGKKKNLNQAEFTYFLFVLLRIASAPVHSSSGCMYQLHSVCTANRTSWKPAQEICMCTKPGVVRVCCTGLCKLMVPHGAPTECPHVFLLGELLALVRKTAGGTWSTCMGVYFRFTYLDLAWYIYETFIWVIVCITTAFMR